MSEVIKVAMAALRKAEVEMRYAGWSVYRDDNLGQFDAMKQVLDAIHFLRNCEGQMKDEALPSQVANHFSTWGDHKTSKDFAAMGAQPPFPQSALQDTNCTRIMREQGKAYPRTCPRCGLGPCAYIPLTTVQKLSMNQDAAGLLHDKAHVDTGKVRPAQSVRTPEMSYRPGSLPMDAEDEPVGWIYKFGKTTFLAKLPLTDEYIVGGWTAEPVFTRPQPLRELSNDEIDKAWRSATIDYTAPYDQFRIDVARAIIDAARKA